MPKAQDQGKPSVQEFRAITLFQRDKQVVLCVSSLPVQRSVSAAEFGYTDEYAKRPLFRFGKPGVDPLNKCMALSPHLERTTHLLPTTGQRSLFAQIFLQCLTNIFECDGSIPKCGACQRANAECVDGKKTGSDGGISRT